MNDKKIYPAVVASIQKDVPSFRIVAKDDSLLMKLLGGIMFFNPAFATSFVTTIGATTYAPRKDIGSAWGVIAHEGVHARDDKRLGAQFKLAYLFPQCLAPLALLAFGGFISHWFLFALAFLLALAPWPAPGRVWAELRGYLMSGCADALMGTDILAPAYIDYRVAHFTTGQYYFMSWRKQTMRAKVIALMMQAKRLVDGTEVLEPYTSTIKVVRDANV